MLHKYNTNTLTTSPITTASLLHTALLVLLGIFGLNVAAVVVNDSSYYSYQVEAAVEQTNQYHHQEHDILIMGRIKSGNLTAITWAHAVNSQQLLDEALNSDIDMIEADIMLGKLNGVGDDIPVMAHPPIDISDITLASFLNQIHAYNQQHEGSEKGVKLDFKSIEVFQGSLGILDDAIPKMNYPVWINADIIAGPVEQNTTVPVDPAGFFAGCMRYRDAVLSIGWTTKWSSTEMEGEYTKAQCDEMLEAITANNVLSTGQEITFPVRAGIAAHSVNQLHDLVRAVNATNNCTLTIWSGTTDFVNVKLLRELIFSFGVERLYLDVPEDLSAQLDLGNTGGGAARFVSLMNFTFISVCFWALSSWLEQRF